MPQTEDALKKAARLFKIVTLIAAASPGTPLGRDEIPDACGCEISTVQRDLNALKRAGVPWEYDPRARAYTLPEKGWAYPIAPLTPQVTQ